MNKLSRAICFAAESFDGKYRKALNSPAIFHSLEAAAVVQTFCEDEEVVCAAVLHDLVEDTAVTIDEIKERFGERVAFLVASETEEKYPDQNPTDTWLIRKISSLEALKSSTDRGVRAMWLGDKLSNMRSFSRLKERLGEDMWRLFNQKDPREHFQYYQVIANELKVFSDTDAYKEYIQLMTKVFGAYNNEHKE